MGVDRVEEMGLLLVAGVGVPARPVAEEVEDGGGDTEEEAAAELEAGKEADAVGVGEEWGEAELLREGLLAVALGDCVPNSTVAEPVAHSVAGEVPVGEADGVREGRGEAELEEVAQPLGKGRALLLLLRHPLCVAVGRGEALLLAVAQPVSVA